MRFPLPHFLRREGRAARRLVERGIEAEARGASAEAIRCYREAIKADRDCAAAHCNLGLMLLDASDWTGAELSLREALRSKAAFPEAWVALAEALAGLGQDEQALDALEQAIGQREGYEGALMSAGALQQKLGRLEAAESSYRRLLASAPDCAPAHNDLGHLLQGLGRTAEAEACFRQALRLAPGSAVAASNLADVLRKLGRLQEAEACCRTALGLEPNLPEAHNNLGTVLQALGRSSESEASLRRALELRPAYRAAHISLGNTLKDLGRVDQALECFRRALSLDPDDQAARDNLVLALNYTHALTRAQVYAEHLEWARRHEAPRAPARRPHANARDPERRLRIGYVSPDFRRHSVAYFIEPILAQHDRAAVEVHCYSNVALPDAMTARLLGLADHAHVISGLGDTDAAQKVRADGIDILVDLAGHTAGHRLGIFAHKPAPVQAAYLGYPNTTGLGAIDWRITDRTADPRDADQFHSERLVRLPKSFLCFQPPQGAPEVRPPPSHAKGFVTFGSFNVLPKMTPEVIRVWSRLLVRVPRSRLFLKALGLGDAASRAHVLDAFAAHGIAADRLTVAPMTATLEAHLALYHDLDIALDPFPFNGTTTTLEALWMGVPVVTLAGDRHSGRVGASILATGGFDEWIATSAEGYVDLAARLAADVNRLAAARASMRARLGASPLLDRAGFVRGLEHAYRAMWVRWCAGSEDPVEPGHRQQPAA